MTTQVTPVGEASPTGTATRSRIGKRGKALGRCGCGQRPSPQSNAATGIGFDCGGSTDRDRGRREDPDEMTTWL